LNLVLSSTTINAFAQPNLGLSCVK